MKLILGCMLSITLLDAAAAGHGAYSDKDHPFVSPLGIAPGPVSAKEVASFQAWLGFDSTDCTCTCEGRRTQWNKECWGQYHFFCKAPPGAEKKGVFGMKCDGHWFLVPAQQRNVMVVCEGEFRTMGVKEATCPKTGITWKKYSGYGCLGSMVGSMNSHRTPTFSALNLPGRAKTPEGSKGLYDDEAMQTLHDWMESSAQQVPLGNATSGKVISEGRCQGMSGQGRALRKADEDSGPWKEMEGMESLEASVHQALGDADLPSSKGSNLGVQPGRPILSVPTLLKSKEKNVFSSILSRMSGSGRLPVTHGSMNCQLECNGAPAWFHGLLPCWGNTTLKCTSGQPTDANPDDIADSEEVAPTADTSSQHSSATGSSGSRPTATSTATSAATSSDASYSSTIGSFVRTVTKPMIDPRAASAAARFVKQHGRLNEAVHGDWGFVFSITCKGLWTGIFGKKCMGLTLEHSNLQSTNVSMDSWGICTGVHGVVTHHDTHGFCMGEFCRGNSVGHSVVMWHFEEADSDDHEGEHGGGVHDDVPKTRGEDLSKGISSRNQFVGSKGQQMSSITSVRHLH